MRIAYFSPLNPVRSGISDYSEDLLPALADLVEVDLFVDDFEPSNPGLVERLALYPIGEYPRRRWDYDMALYHIGNNLYHEAIYRMALRYPGIAVLHDYALVGVIGSMTLARDDRGGFVREWGYNYGPASLSHVRAILAGHASLPPDEPLNRRLLDLSLGLIVHSDHLQRRVLQTCPRANVAHVPMPCVSHQPPALTSCPHLPSLALTCPGGQCQGAGSARGRAVPGERSRRAQAARRELGLEADGLYIGSFGFMAPSKQVEPLLDVYADLLGRFPSARLLFVGEALDWFDPLPLIAARGLADRVTITGYLPFATWYAYMLAVDVAVNLRYPSLGETSAAVLRLMGEGVPTIVSDVGWYAELPDDCVLKVGVGETMRADLAAALVRLLEDPQRRVELGRRGRDHVAAQHTVEKAARCYVDFVREVMHGFTW